MIGADGVVVGTTTTGTDGTFVFDGVPPGTYTLVESTRPGFTDVTDSDGGDPNSITVTVAPGVDTMGLEFIDEEPSSGPSASPTNCSPYCQLQPLELLHQLQPLEPQLLNPLLRQPRHHPHRNLLLLL